MKTLYLSIIVILIFSTLLYLKPIQADNTRGIEIQNIQVEPPTIKVGDTFTVTATLVNNSTVPMVLEGGTCVPLIEHVPFFTIILDNHTKIKAKNLNCAGVGLSKILNPGKNINGTSPDSTFAYIATESGTANVTVTFSYHVTSQPDSTQPNIEQTISKSLLFTIYDNNTETKPVHETIQSPLKQFKLGTLANNVTCNQGLDLIFKSEDNSPACVKTVTAFRLLALGWGYLPSPFVTKTDILDSQIIGGKIIEFNYDLQSTSIIIKIQTSSNGNLNVTIPKFLTDLNPHYQFKTYTVLTDGMEVVMNKTTTAKGPSFSIPFTNGTQQIEIIGNQIGQLNGK